MTFQPVVPASGLVGWQFLQRTYDAQFEAFKSSFRLQDNTEYFLENIKDVTSAAQLVEDRRLLEVALGAFGLQDDINNKYFIQVILQEGTTDDEALANKLTDERYAEFSKAFGFGPGELQYTSFTVNMGAVADNYLLESFERSVGDQDDTMRIALYGQREMAELAEDPMSEEAKWFTVLGQPPLRELFRTALGLPQSFGQVDIEKQAEIFRERAQSVLGTSDLSEFSDEGLREKLITIYHARAQIDSFAAGSSSNAIALTLLRS